VQRDEEAYKRAMTAVDNQILDLLPKIKEAKQTVDLLNRVTMSFDVVLEKGADHVPKVGNGADVYFRFCMVCS